MTNPVSWFEIATNDIERAKSFYEKVFLREFKFMEVNGEKLYIFDADYEGYGSGGALIESKSFKPTSESGTLIYFSSDDVAIELERIEAAGGKIVMPKTSLGDPGFIAQFVDTEGNKIGLYSGK